MDKPQGPYYANQPVGPCFHYPPDVQLIAEVENQKHVYFCIFCGQYETPGQTVQETVRYQKYTKEKREKIRQKLRQTGQPVEPTREE